MQMNGSYVIIFRNTESVKQFIKQWREISGIRLIEQMETAAIATLMLSNGTFAPSPFRGKVGMGVGSVVKKICRLIPAHLALGWLLKKMTGSFSEANISN